MKSRPNATVAILDLSTVSQEKECASVLDAAMRKFDGLTVLEWSVRRLSESTVLDAIVVTGDSTAEELCRRLCLCSAVPLFFDRQGSCGRARLVAESSQAQWLVFVEPTCPFVDPVLLDRLIASAWGNPDCDYVGFFASKRPELPLSRLGLVGEICHRRAIDEQSLYKEAQMSNVPVPLQIRSQPERFQTRLIPLPSMLEAEDLRFKIHSAEDCLDASLLLEAAGDDLSYQRLARLSETTRDSRRQASLSY